MRRQADSRGWNSHRQLLLQELANTGNIVGEIPHATWGFLVSRHAGGINAAFVAINRLKKAWPQLEFKALNTRDNDDVAWDAEIYAKLKSQEVA